MPTPTPHEFDAAALEVIAVVLVRKIMQDAEDEYERTHPFPQEVA